MSKTTSKQLFQLIKSLNKTEKRYFKMFCRLHMIGNENKYVRLFDEIEKQTDYDENKLKQLFNAGSFRMLKKFLYHHILKALRQYHHSIHSQVSDLIHESEILYEKGLYEQSGAILKSAKIIAGENEMFWELLKIYKINEMNLAIKMSDMDWVKKIMTEESRQMELFQNAKIYRDLYYNLADQYYRYGAARSKKHLRRIEAIISNKYLQNESLAISADAKIRLYEILGMYSQIKGDLRNRYRYFKNALHYMDENPKKIKLSLNNYIAVVSNALASCQDINKLDEIPMLIDKLEKLIPITKSQGTSGRLFFIIFYHKLNFYIVTGQADKSENSLKIMLPELPLYENRLSDFEKINLFTHIAISFFSMGNWKQCIFWLNRIRNEISFTIRENFESFFRLFYLIAHFEAGNQHILPSLIRSIYRFLHKKDRLYKFESAVLYFLRNWVPKSNTEGELRNQFQKLRNKIILHMEDPLEKNILQYFDYISWLESKIENRPFAEVVKEKAEKILKEENSSQD